MTKVFNIDELAKEERSIVLKGEKHQVLEMTVETYLETMKIAEELDKDANKSNTEAQINAVIKTITLAVPTISPDVLKKLPFHQMNAIATFVQGDIPAELKDAVKTEVKTDEENVKQAEEVKNV